MHAAVVVSTARRDAVQQPREPTLTLRSLPWSTAEMPTQRTIHPCRSAEPLGTLPIRLDDRS